METTAILVGAAPSEFRRRRPYRRALADFAGKLSYFCAKQM
jgi:hypothetical protein